MWVCHQLWFDLDYSHKIEYETTVRNYLIITVVFVKPQAFVVFLGQTS